MLWEKCNRAELEALATLYVAAVEGASPYEELSDEQLRQKLAVWSGRLRIQAALSREAALARHALEHGADSPFQWPIPDSQGR